jgi:hypothetical protein
MLPAAHFTGLGRLLQKINPNRVLTCIFRDRTEPRVEFLAASGKFRLGSLSRNKGDCSLCCCFTVPCYVCSTMLPAAHFTGLGRLLQKINPNRDELCIFRDRTEPRVEFLAASGKFRLGSLSRNKGTYALPCYQQRTSPASGDCFKRSIQIAY